MLAIGCTAVASCLVGQLVELSEQAQTLKVGLVDW
jgi:hypothetical protein